MTDSPMTIPNRSFAEWVERQTVRSTGSAAATSKKAVLNSHKDLKFRVIDPRPKLHALVSESRTVRTAILNACSKQGIPADKFTIALLSVIDHYVAAPEAVRAEKLPNSAPELYSERAVIAGTNRREDITEFLRRVWKPWIDNGLLTRAELRKLDLKADKAIENWMNNKRFVPEDIRLLTKRESLDKQIEADPKAAMHNPRLARVIISRIQRGMPVPGF